jgi:hypothetical protein
MLRTYKAEFAEINIQEMQPVPGLENDPQLSPRIYPLSTFELNSHQWAVRAVNPSKIKLAGNNRTGIFIVKRGTKKADGALIFEVRNTIEGAAVQSPQIMSNAHEALRFAAWIKTQFRTHKIYAATPEVRETLRIAGVDPVAIFN